MPGIEWDDRALKASDLSEDYWFCARVREIGLKIWICPWVKLKHVGMHIFTGSLVD